MSKIDELLDKLTAVAKAAREAEQLFHEHTFTWETFEQRPGRDYVRLTYSLEFKEKFMTALDNLSQALEALDEEE